MVGHCVVCRAASCAGRRVGDRRFPAISALRSGGRHGQRSGRDGRHRPVGDDPGLRDGRRVRDRDWPGLAAGSHGGEAGPGGRPGRAGRERARRGAVGLAGRSGHVLPPSGDDDSALPPSSGARTSAAVAGNWSEGAGYRATGKRSRASIRDGPSRTGQTLPPFSSVLTIMSSMTSGTCAAAVPQSGQLSASTNKAPHLPHS